MGAEVANNFLASQQAAFEALPPVMLQAHGHAAMRRESLAAALAAGLPAARNEAWKYTSLRALSARRFLPLVSSARVEESALADIPAPRIVFVNGVFDGGLSRLEGMSEGLSVAPLSGALAGGDGRASFVLGRRFDRDDEVFARLNAALAIEGVLVSVAEGVVVGEPLHLVFAGAPAAGDSAHHLRHLVELRENARLSLVEHHVGVADNGHLCNHLLHVHLKPGARLAHARLQVESAGASLIARTDAVLASDADYRRVDVELGAALSRHELNVSLQGRGARLHSGGVLLADGRRHVDTRLGIEHVAGNTSCELLWRGLAQGRGRAVFHGGILIRTGADGSSAMLSNKNLLLSDQAEIDAQPVLEIHADEVQAAHGATVGRLDENALFYLRSRGLDAEAARALLVRAFCHEALRPLQDEVLAGFLSSRLDAHFATTEPLR